MTSITQQELAPGILNVILNRPEKGNALDDKMIAQLTEILEAEADNPETRVLILSANGKHFCTGADLAYMQQMIDYSVDENLDDAKRLGKLFHTLYYFPKPTIALVHGPSYGGGLGLIAACDMAISTQDAVFCFSEVKLGLTPATIAPFVINAIGPHHAKHLFLTAEQFDVSTAHRIGLVHEIVDKTDLEDRVKAITSNLLQHGQNALITTKKLVQDIVFITPELEAQTAKLIAEVRTSEEAQTRCRAFFKNISL